jgi:hypothetical protein
MTRMHIINIIQFVLNPLNARLNPIRHLLALVGARHIVHVSGITVKHRHTSIFIFVATFRLQYEMGYLIFNCSLIYWKA